MNRDAEKARLQEDIELLRGVRGSFADATWEDRSSRANHLFFTILFGLGFPVLFSVLLLNKGLAAIDWKNGDQLAVAILIPASAALGWFFWYRGGGEYEFSRDGILLRRRGKVLWSVDYAKVEDVDLSPDAGRFRMKIKSGGRTHSFLMPRSLQAAFRENHARPQQGTGRIQHASPPMKDSSRPTEKITITLRQPGSADD